MVYVCQTSSLLETRLSEQKAAVKHAKIDVSAAAEHVWKLGHQRDFQATSILDHENNQFRRYALQSWHIPAWTGNHMYSIEVFFYPFHFLHYFISLLFRFLYFAHCDLKFWSARFLNTTIAHRSSLRKVDYEMYHVSLETTSQVIIILVCAHRN